MRVMERYCIYESEKHSLVICKTLTTHWFIFEMKMIITQGSTLFFPCGNLLDKYEHSCLMYLANEDYAAEQNNCSKPWLSNIRPGRQNHPARGSNPARAMPLQNKINDREDINCNFHNFMFVLLFCICIHYIHLKPSS